MLAIGRAFMSKNDFLLLDELSLGLAPLIVQSIFEVVSRINKTGISILLVEQNVPVTLRIADIGPMSWKAGNRQTGRGKKHS